VTGRIEWWDIGEGARRVVRCGGEGENTHGGGGMVTDGKGEGEEGKWRGYGGGCGVTKPCSKKGEGLRGIPKDGGKRVGKS